jgi:hypothetical protein
MTVAHDTNLGEHQFLCYGTEQWHITQIEESINFTPKKKVTREKEEWL